MIIKKVSTILIASFLAINSYCQNTDVSTYTDEIKIDTLIPPDYYKVYIKIAEYKVSTYTKKKGREDIFVDCDTLAQLLKFKLDSMNFSAKLTLVKVSDKKMSYARTIQLDSPNPNFKQETYLLTVKSIDDARAIYNKLKFKGLYGMQISPFYSKTTIVALKDVLQDKATKISKKHAENYCKKSGFSTVEISSIQQYSYSLQNLNINNNMSSNNDLYDVDFEVKPITYSLNIVYKISK